MSTWRTFLQCDICGRDFSSESAFWQGEMCSPCTKCGEYECYWCWDAGKPCRSKVIITSFKQEELPPKPK